MKVLLIEDSPGQAAVIVGFLEAGLPQARINHVETLAAGLRSVTERDFDLVLLDLGLPDGEGLEVVSAMSQTAPDIPIVILTAQGEDGMGNACIQAGADDFVCKDGLDAKKLARAVVYGASRRTANVARDLGRTVAELRAIYRRDAEAPTRFGESYENLLVGLHRLGSPAHRDLMDGLAKARVSGDQLVALHTSSLEAVCKDARDSDQTRYLAEASAILITNLMELANGYR